MNKENVLLLVMKTFSFFLLLNIKDINICYNLIMTDLPNSTQDSV